MDGKLHRGHYGGAGGIDHALVDLEDPIGVCGRYGCLDTFPDRTAVARRTSRALGR